jgi:hypothetical protein
VGHHVGGKTDPDPAVAHVHHAVGVLQDALDAVLGHHDGDCEVVHEPGHGGQHLLGAGRVECRRWLVEHQHPGVGGEDGADRDPLLLAAGQVAQVGVTQVGDPEQVEGLLHALAHGGGGESELLHP